MPRPSYGNSSGMIPPASNPESITAVVSRISFSIVPNFHYQAISFSPVADTEARKKLSGQEKGREDKKHTQGSSVSSTQ